MNTDQWPLVFGFMVLYFLINVCFMMLCLSIFKYRENEYLAISKQLVHQTFVSLFLTLAFTSDMWSYTVPFNIYVTIRLFCQDFIEFEMHSSDLLKDFGFINAAFYRRPWKRCISEWKTHKRCLWVDYCHFQILILMYVNLSMTLKQVHTCLLIAVSSQSELVKSLLVTEVCLFQHHLYLPKVAIGLTKRQTCHIICNKLTTTTSLKVSRSLN